MTTTEAFFTSNPRMETQHVIDETVFVDAHSRLPAESEACRLLHEMDVAGEPLADIDTGGRHYVIVSLKSFPSSVIDSRLDEYLPFGPQTPLTLGTQRRFELERRHPYMVVRLEAERTITARGLERGRLFTLGKDEVQIALNTGGDQLRITNDTSVGVVVRYGTRRGEAPVEARSERFTERLATAAIDNLVGTHGETKGDPIRPDYSYALAMRPDELWAKPNNGGKPQDRQYIEHYQNVRRRLVDAFESGRLYQSPEALMSFLRDTHRYLATTGDYNRLVGRLRTDEYGVFRTGGSSWNGRREQSLEAARIARTVGDTYGAGTRFTRGPRNGESVSRVMLPGISPYNLPSDIVRYDENGMAKRVSRIRSDTGYCFNYPHSDAIVEYMKQIQGLGQAIEAAVKYGETDRDKVADMISRQYQYFAIARPFPQINNSIAMQFFNAQIKLLGYRGVTHGDMDIVAQRLQPGPFSRYASARVKGLLP